MPTTRIDVEGYTYDHETGTTDLDLTKYVGSETDISTPIIETLAYYTLRIEPTPSDATVTLIADGYTQDGNEIVVLGGTTVTYTVSRVGYDSVENIPIVVNANTTLPISLVPKTYTFTVVPNPADASVHLTAEGYTQVDNHIVVHYGTEVLYELSKIAYTTARGLVTVKENTSLTVNLVKAGNAAKFMNYGTCVVCFMMQGLRVFDLEYVYNPYTEHYDYGTNLTTGYFDEFIDCGGLDG